MHYPSTVLQVSRNAAALVNSYDDNGILDGRWEEPYDDGTDPEEWTGSAKILAQFNRSKEPVRYGQCFVFAGVLTTGNDLTLQHAASLKPLKR